MCDIDDLIDRLTSATDGRCPVISEEEIEELCCQSRDVLLDESSLLELDAPLNVCGDIHGQFSDLLRLFNDNGHPPDSNYLFMGDIVDRGSQSIEVASLLLSYKVRYPNNVYIIRGNHEEMTINEIYGFLEECKRRYASRGGKRVHGYFNSAFDCLPLAAVIENKIFCAHGGLSPKLKSLDQIRRIERPRGVPSRGLMCDLLWSDPDPTVTGFRKNRDRGVSFVFGEDAVAAFLEKFDLDLIARAHECVHNGYKFFADRKLVTIFSAPNYTPDMHNSGAVMSVNRDLVCTFKILKPEARS